MDNTETNVIITIPTLDFKNMIFYLVQNIIYF